MPEGFNNWTGHAIQFNTRDFSFFYGDNFKTKFRELYGQILKIQFY